MYVCLIELVICIGLLRGDDDIVQLISAFTTREGVGSDGSGVHGDGHIRTITAGGTAAIRSHLKQTNACIRINKYKKMREQLISSSSCLLWFTCGWRVCGSSGWGFCGIYNDRAR